MSYSRQTPVNFLPGDSAAISAMKEILAIGKTEDREWFSFLIQNADGTMFHTPAYEGGRNDDGGKAAGIHAWLVSMGLNVVGVVHNHPMYPSWPKHGMFLTELSGRDTSYAARQGATKALRSARDFFLVYGLMRDGTVLRHQTLRGMPGKVVDNIGRLFDTLPTPSRAPGSEGRWPSNGANQSNSRPPEASGGTSGGGGSSGSSSRGSDYRESGGPKPTKGKTDEEKPTGAGGGGTPVGPTSGDQGRLKLSSTGTDEEYLPDGRRVVRYPDGSKEIVPPGGMSSAERAEKEQEAKEKADKEKAEKEKKESDEKKDEKPPEKKEEKKKDDEDDENAQQNTTRGNPLDDDGETDHESRRFTHHYMPPETRALFAFTELGRALAPKGPPLPGSGGPTDRGWTPFRARTAAAGPPESAAYGREALKNAFAGGAIGGALAGRPYHGPTDDGGQVPVAADARTSGDESDADAKASRDSVRQMIWNKHVAPRIRYARRMQ